MTEKPNADRRPGPAIPRPSASVVLISPTNQVLLLHRVETSSSFPSAHVFPGGNVSAAHDGRVPDLDHPARHVDSNVYRMAAVRETFEESGILLARNKLTGKLLNVSDAQREKARKDVLQNKIAFPTWLASQSGVADIESLIPFTRWITPPQVPKRYTTQMYIYFLPLPSSESVDPSIGPLPVGAEAVIPNPTPDGGVEHTAARFLPAQTWISMANSGEIVLFPPQFFLLSIVARFLAPVRQDAYSNVELQQHRRRLETFVRGGNPSLEEACISPRMIGQPLKDGRYMLGLDYPGSEVIKLGRQGVKDYVVILGRNNGGSPSQLETRLRKDVDELLDKSSL